jgi:flagellar biosynthesis/type III secretory pathway M-ring protein FliF/YscJ
MGIDTAIIWLIFSKVSYEFIRYFPYQILVDLNIPFAGFLSSLNNDTINYWKNVAVLIFFIILLLVIGIYEIRKYTRKQVELRGEADLEADRLISPQPTKNDEEVPFKESETISEESLPITDEIETADREENLLEKEEDIENDDSNEYKF